MTTDMLMFVLKRLRQPDTNLATVVAETGLKRSWLWQLKDGRIADPSVRKIQVLANYFQAREEASTSPNPNPRPASGPGAKSAENPAAAPAPAGAGTAGIEAARLQVLS